MIYAETTGSQTSSSSELTVQILFNVKISHFELKFQDTF